MVESSLGPGAKEEIYVFLKVKIGITHWEKPRQTSPYISAPLLTNSETTEPQL